MHAHNRGRRTTIHSTAGSRWHAFAVKSNPVNHADRTVGNTPTTSPARDSSAYPCVAFRIV